MRRGTDLTLLGVGNSARHDITRHQSALSLSLSLSVIKRRFSSARSCDGATEGRRRWNDAMSVVHNQHRLYSQSQIRLYSGVDTPTRLPQ